MKRLLKKMMIWFMWYPFRMLVNVLPHKVSYWIGGAGGTFLYFISKDKRRIMADELKQVFPEKSPCEILATVKKSFINYVVSELEVLLYPSMSPAYIRKMVRIEGKSHLDRTLLKGKGVLLFQAHFGAFQMVMPAIGYSGYRMNQLSASATVWKEDKNSGLEKKAFDIKAAHEYTLPVKHVSITSSIRPLFRALEKNEIVGITIDGGGGKKIIPVNFLGRTANFQTGAVSIALKTDAEIIPAIMITQKEFMHQLFIHPPLHIAKTEDKDANIKAVLKQYINILEGYIRRYPDHYGYTLYLRKSRESIDPYPFFIDGKANADIRQ